LNGATLAVAYTYNGVFDYKAAVITPDYRKPDVGEDVDPNRILTYYLPVVDLLDVPTKNSNDTSVTNYTIWINMTGYTDGWQQIFLEANTTSLTSGKINPFFNGAVPPLTYDFNIVLGWNKWQQPGFKEAVSNDLDLYVWLPDDSLNTDPGQPASFIVGYKGDASWGDTQYVENDSYGTMTDFPFARLKREGGYVDGAPNIESTSVLYRANRGGGTVLPNANLPYWAGAYTVMATDYGQTIDQDNDGCGDNYGYDFKPVWTGPAGTGGPNYYDPTTDPDCPLTDMGGTLGIPLLGAYYTPFAYVWQAGAVRHFVSGANNYGPWSAEAVPAYNENCNDHWWKAFQIFTTTTSTAPVYTSFATPGGKPLCDDGLASGFIPYGGYTNTDPNDRLSITAIGK
jgi:hypothetical protein